MNHKKYRYNRLVKKSSRSEYLWRPHDSFRWALCEWMEVTKAYCGFGGPGSPEPERFGGKQVSTEQPMAVAFKPQSFKNQNHNFVI
jgi:hypothetical protein